MLLRPLHAVLLVVNYTISGLCSCLPSVEAPFCLAGLMTNEAEDRGHLDRVGQPVSPMQSPDAVNQRSQGPCKASVPMPRHNPSAAGDCVAQISLSEMSNP